MKAFKILLTVLTVGSILAAYKLLKKKKEKLEDLEVEPV